MKAIEIRHISILKDDDYSLGIFKVLTANEDEFVPRLSARSSVTQKDFCSSEFSVKGLVDYFWDIMKQPAIVALYNGKVVGFMSYRRNQHNTDIPVTMCENAYVTTVIIDKKMRGKGIARKFYKLLFDLSPERFVYTRTWSTNIAHISLLESMGFDNIHTITDDRGKGIDTVYYGKVQS